MAVLVAHLICKDDMLARMTAKVLHPVVCPNSNPSPNLGAPLNLAPDFLTPMCEIKERHGIAKR